MTTVEQIPGEQSRFFVESGSRPGLFHVVDMEWSEHPGQKPKPSCGCEENFIKGKPCRHIKAVQEYLRQPDYTEADFKPMPP